MLTEKTLFFDSRPASRSAGNNNEPEFILNERINVSYYYIDEIKFTNYIPNVRYYDPSDPTDTTRGISIGLRNSNVDDYETSAASVSIPTIVNLDTFINLVNSLFIEYIGGFGSASLYRFGPNKSSGFYISQNPNKIGSLILHTRNSTGVVIDQEDDDADGFPPVIKLTIYSNTKTPEEFLGMKDIVTMLGGDINFIRSDAFRYFYIYAITETNADIDIGENRIQIYSILEDLNDNITSHPINCYDFKYPKNLQLHSNLSQGNIPSDQFKYSKKESVLGNDTIMSIDISSSTGEIVRWKNPQTIDINKAISQSIYQFPSNITFYFTTRDFDGEDRIVDFCGAPVFITLKYYNNQHGRRF